MVKRCSSLELALLIHYNPHPKCEATWQVDPECTGRSAFGALGLHLSYEPANFALSRPQHPDPASPVVQLLHGLLPMAWALYERIKQGFPTPIISGPRVPGLLSYRFWCQDFKCSGSSASCTNCSPATSKGATSESFMILRSILLALLLSSPPLSCIAPVLLPLIQEFSSATPTTDSKPEPGSGGRQGRCNLQKSAAEVREQARGLD